MRIMETLDDKEYSGSLVILLQDGEKFVKVIQRRVEDKKTDVLKEKLLFRNKNSCLKEKRMKKTMHRRVVYDSIEEKCY